jgi:hypothetical protein
MPDDAGMADYCNAFEISPVPAPGPDVKPPEAYRGIYGMPMFVTIPTPDLAASVEFWLHGLGFIDLFTIPGRLTHLRTQRNRHHRAGVRSSNARMHDRTAADTVEHRRPAHSHARKDAGDLRGGAPVGARKRAGPVSA